MQDKYRHLYHPEKKKDHIRVYIYSETGSLYCGRSIKWNYSIQPGDGEDPTIHQIVFDLLLEDTKKNGGRCYLAKGFMAVCLDVPINKEDEAPLVLSDLGKRPTGWIRLNFIGNLAPIMNAIDQVTHGVVAQ